jgi:hypothetical protein
MASHRRKHQQEIAHEPVVADQPVEQISPAIPPRLGWPSRF